MQFETKTDVEVFTTKLWDLSKARMTRYEKDGYAVKSSLKAEDGHLYFLNRCFFFLPKPPTLIVHLKIDYVEFEEHPNYFDLLIMLDSGYEHFIRNIQINERHNLVDFISSKGLNILDVGKVHRRVADVLLDDADVLLDDDDVFDTYLESVKKESDGEESDEEQ